MPIYRVRYNYDYKNEDFYVGNKNYGKYILDKFPDRLQEQEVIRDNILISSKLKDKFYFDNNNLVFERFIMPDVEEPFFKFAKQFRKKFGNVIPENPDFEFKLTGHYKKDRFENDAVFYVFEKVNVEVFFIPSTFHRYFDGEFEYFIDKIKIFEKEYKQLFMFSNEIKYPIYVEKIEIKELQ